MGKIFFQAFLVLHLLGMGLIVGGVVTDLFARRLEVSVAGTSPDNAKAAVEVVDLVVRYGWRCGFAGNDKEVTHA